jgi:DNA-binding transcriptional MerR regulator
MRISQLSAESGVPIATIKYYLREGLLPQGEQTSATRAEYGARHLRRLRLIRALLEVGRLPLAAIRKVIDAVEDEETSVFHMLGTAHWALAHPVEPHTDDEEWQGAREETDRLIGELGWTVDPESPTRGELAQTLVKLHQLGMSGDVRPYAEAAERLVAEHELGKVLGHSREGAVEALVLGTVLYGRVLDVVRRMAHESEAAKALSPRPEA